MYRFQTDCTTLSFCCLSCSTTTLNNLWLIMTFIFHCKDSLGPIFCLLTEIIFCLFLISETSYYQAFISFNWSTNIIWWLLFYYRDFLGPSLGGFLLDVKGFPFCCDITALSCFCMVGFWSLNFWQIKKYSTYT